MRIYLFVYFDCLNFSGKSLRCPNITSHFVTVAVLNIQLMSCNGMKTLIFS